MTFNTKYGLVAAAMLLSCSANAAPQHFNLSVDTQSPIGPDQTLTISLATLDPSQGTYDVHCSLQANKVLPIKTKMDDPQSAEFLVNSRSVSLGWSHLENGTNDILISNVNALSGNFYMKNKGFSHWSNPVFFLTAPCDVVTHVDAVPLS